MINPIWKETRNGNIYTKVKGVSYLIFGYKNGYKIKVDDKFGTIEYNSVYFAKKRVSELIQHRMKKENK